MDVPNKRRQEPYRRMTARNAVPNQPEDEPTSMGEAIVKAYKEPRKDDAAYQSYLKKGSKASGTLTASETGARGMANQGEIDRLKGLLKTGKRLEGERARKAKREIA
jgi:hypothetical protein